MPRDGSIRQHMHMVVLSGAIAPLVVAIFAVVALALAGGQAIAIAAVVVIAVALALSLYMAGKQREDALQHRFGRAIALANEVATVRLPEALEAARDGRPVTDAQVPLVPDVRDELTELMAALDRTQRTAITLASEQGRLRRQAGEMFTDLGRRHQSLLGRTLALVAELEANEHDPATVADLLRLDHLLTRMRRNAESLLVLAGSEPGRGWKDALALDEVVRVALGEIEAFDRVDIGVLEPDRVVGRAVGAVSHVLAELLENATVFSPPDSHVTVNGLRRPDGYLLSVVDRGIGLRPNDLSAANARLTQFRTVEFTPPRRLGLAVVAELARRHGIVVQLADAPGGGTTASVLLPPVLLAGAAVDTTAPAPGATIDLRAAPGAPIVPVDVIATPELAAAGAPEPPAVEEPAADALPEEAEPAEVEAAEPEPVPDTIIDLVALESEPVEVVGAGALPRRARGAHLPDTGPVRDPAAAAPPRTADDVRHALTSFQHGVARGALERELAEGEDAQ
jgi:signal transduction histidine kinase